MSLRPSKPNIAKTRTAIVDSGGIYMSRNHM